MVSTWSFLANISIPLGGFLAVLLLTGVPFLVRVARAVSSKGFSLGFIKWPVSLFFLVFSLGVVATSYVSMQYNKTERDMSDSRLFDRFQGLQWRAERNWWIALSSSIIWAVVWRMGTLMDPNRKPYQTSSFFKRVLYVIIGLTFLGLADLPFARLDYNYQISQQVTPIKVELMRIHGETCGKAMFKETKECRAFCDNVRELAMSRSEIMETVRWWHPGGRIGAQVFDTMRGMNQEGRVDKLLDERPCFRVLSSVDKTNDMVNYFCLAMTFLLTLFSCSMISAGFSGPFGRQRMEFTYIDLEPTAPPMEKKNM